MKSINKEDLKQYISKYNIIFLIILVIGILIRIVGIANMPNALNCDEASAGYEAFSILNYGIDRNGNFMPAFLVAWGSGQNALLTYLIIPFIKLFGLNVIAIRLPMAILGIISLFIMYSLLKKISNKKLAIVGFAFFAICPWHIMKSRWGLESNLFPDLILIFVYMLVKGIEDKKKILYYLSFAIAGISAYAYGTSYFFLPFFIIPLLVILIKKEKITVFQAILGLLIIAIVALPIILMVIINTFNLPQINLPFVTIPKMEVNRFKVMTSVFSGGFFYTSIKNFITSLGILVTQYDWLPWNSIMPFGTIYLFSTIFTIIGLIDSFKKEKIIKIKYDYIFNIWFIACVLLTFICEPNINRLNIIMIPIIYYTIKGIYLSIEFFNKKNQKRIVVGIVILYVLSFVLFLGNYFKEDCSNYATFENNVKEVFEYVKDIKDKEIYVTDKMKAPYIYALFYTNYNTEEFVNTVNYEDKNVEFRNVLGFGNYHFEKIKELYKGNIYIIKNYEKQNYDLTNYTITEFEDYVVIE